MSVGKASIRPPLPKVFWVFAKVGALTLGGGYAMIPLIRAELVRGRAWLCDDEFAEIFGLAQTAPGAIVINTAIFVGYRLRRLVGALTACLGVVMPSFAIILAIAASFGRLRYLAVVDRMFRGIRPAVVGIILAAVLSMGQSLLRAWPQWAIAALLFVLSLSLRPHPVLVITLAGLAGVLLHRPGISSPAETRGTDEKESP